MTKKTDVERYLEQKIRELKQQAKRNETHIKAFRRRLAKEIIAYGFGPLPEALDQLLEDAIEARAIQDQINDLNEDLFNFRRARS